MKKVAIVIQDITQMAGTERAVCNLSNILADSGEYCLKIISVYSSDGKPVYFLNSNIKIIHLGISRPRNAVTTIRAYTQTGAALRKICSEQSIEIIIGTNVAINATFIAIRKKGVVTVACEHMGGMPVSIYNRVFRKFVYPNLSSVVVLTNRDANRYGHCKNVSVIPNSLSFVPRKQADLNANVILAVGRLTYQKGFDMLVSAIALIKEKCRGWQVRIVGDGEDKETLLRQIRDGGLEDIIKIIQPTDKIEDEYYNAAFYAMSSRYEGLPMALIEAKSCGLPIVSFDCPEGPADVIRNGIDGILVANGNVETLAEAILKLIENPQMRKNMGREALKDIKRFCPERIFQMWDVLLKKLI